MEWDRVHLVLRPLFGLLYQSKMMMMMIIIIIIIIIIVEQSVECELARETEVLGWNLPSATLSTTNPIWHDLGSNPTRRGGNPVTTRLSTALYKCYLVQCSDKGCTVSIVTWMPWLRKYTRAETTVQQTWRLHGKINPFFVEEETPFRNMYMSRRE
jgi:hypothetical protein